LLFDGSGAEYQGTIERVSKNDVQIRIREKYNPQVESPLSLILFQGIPKADKMDLIVKGTTELGIRAIIPLFSFRTIPRWKGNNLTRKVLHWQKIAIEAARQSGRTTVPKVREPLAFEKIAKEIENLNDNALKIILWEDEQERSIKEVLKAHPKIHEIYCFVGPEGGFSAEEVGLLKSKGCISIHLGNRILRTETAAIALLSIIQYEWGDLG
jgi:16S rRNA (uracil1498-N3)-methyltransferase